MQQVLTEEELRNALLRLETEGFMNTAKALREVISLIADQAERARPIDLNKYPHVSDR